MRNVRIAPSLMLSAAPFKTSTSRPCTSICRRSIDRPIRFTKVSRVMVGMVRVDSSACANRSLPGTFPARAQRKGLLLSDRREPAAVASIHKNLALPRTMSGLRGWIVKSPSQAVEGQILTQKVGGVPTVRPRGCQGAAPVCGRGSSNIRSLRRHRHSNPPGEASESGRRRFLLLPPRGHCAFGNARAARPELILIDANAVVESMDGAGHDRQRLPRRASLTSGHGREQPKRPNESR